MADPLFIGPMIAATCSRSISRRATATALNSSLSLLKLTSLIFETLARLVQLVGRELRALQSLAAEARQEAGGFEHAADGQRRFIGSRPGGEQRRWRPGFGRRARVLSASWSCPFGWDHSVSTGSPAPR